MSKISCTNRKVRKVIIIGFAWLIVIWGGLELALLLFDDEILFKRTIDPEENHLVEAQKFFDSSRYDPLLGWDYDPVVKNFDIDKTYLAQSYGDSFVESGQGGRPTWQDMFERITGKSILNLGVGGYGLDQAVLKFERNSKNYKTKIAILGLYQQEFRRNLSYHSFYYFRGSGKKFLYAFKPMFVPDSEGFTLITPPCENASCIENAVLGRNQAVNEVLENHDYWYQMNSRLPTLSFPRVMKYIMILPRVQKLRAERQGKENYIFVNETSVKVAQYLVKRFVSHSKKQGMVPICLLFYNKDDLRIIKNGKRYDSPLIDFLKKENIAFIDPVPYIFKMRPDDSDFTELAVPDGHNNELGDRLLAEALADGMKKLGILQESFPFD